MANRIVTLTTDFGWSDPYAGAMKGVILSLAPQVTLVDLSHGVAAHDLLDAAYTLAQAYSFFPSDTIHLIVVDPGVGTARRPILVRAGTQLLIAPDNGVLSLVYDQEAELLVRHITASHYFRTNPSQTFHGRDVFAPVAGWLAKGVEPEKFGDPITDFVRFAIPKPKAAAGEVRGVVLKVDRFGNLITNLTIADLPSLAPDAPEGPAGFSLTVGKGAVTALHRAYADAAPNEVFAIWGSAGYLELSANRASAARLCAADRGAEVVVKLAL